MKAYTRLLALLATLALGLLLAACSVKLVADYDATAFEEILAVGKKVDRFYGSLLEAPPGQRPYSAFSQQYVEIETDMRAMLRRNKARALNSESIEIAEIILKRFIRHKDRHKSANTYGDFNAKADRDRMTRLFASAASAEEAKKLSADDKNADKD
jgi:hypothetical protein